MIDEQNVRVFVLCVKRLDVAERSASQDIGHSLHGGGFAQGQVDTMLKPKHLRIEFFQIAWRAKD